MKEGKPYVMFGDGNLASCKPISEADLASFIADCVTETDKVNQVRLSIQATGTDTVIRCWTRAGSRE